MENRHSLLAVTAMVYVLTGAPYAIGSAPITFYLIQNRSLMTFAGITFYRGSFIHSLGLDWVIAASLLFSLIGAGFVIVGSWLWKGRRIGAITALALFPVIMALAVGGEAPLPLVIEPLKLVMVLGTWKFLK